MGAFYGRRGIGVASVAALAVVILGLLLGFWQLRRADEKASLQLAQERAAAGPALDLGAGPGSASGASPGPADTGSPGAVALPDPAAVDGERLQASGAFVAARTIFLDNRTREGIAGFHVLTPLKLVGRDSYLMVLRGWVAGNPSDRARLPEVTTPSGPVRVEGLAVADLPQPMMLGAEPAPQPGDRLWQHFDYGKFSSWSGLALYPVVLRQTVEPDYRDGLARDWNQPGVSVDRHLGYAFQWFALTAAAILTWLILLWRRKKRRDV
jgi:surfeit locus 1 family protein